MGLPAPAPQPAQQTLSPQGESMLASFLKESVAAQARVVDKLFDEMKVLSRKIDEKKQAPQQMPPIVVNMQQPGFSQAGPPPMRPIAMDLPSAQQQVGGLPRHAASDLDEGDNGERPRRKVSKVALEQVPEELEPLDAGERAPAPRGWPGLEPVTDTEPEPELATEEQAEEPAAAGAPDMQPREHPAAARSSEDVRKELRDYLNGVRDKLDKEKPASPGDLLDYLGKLSDYLPEREKKRFRGSNERLAMESLKAHLAGKKGLLRKIADTLHAVAPRRKGPMTRSLVVDTFSYLKDLAAWHPEKAVAAGMRERIESIVARMGRSK
jgi:hypothetical protein